MLCFVLATFALMSLTIRHLRLSAITDPVAAHRPLIQHSPDSPARCSDARSSSVVIVSFFPCAICRPGDNASLIRVRAADQPSVQGPFRRKIFVRRRLLSVVGILLARHVRLWPRP